MVPWFLYQLEDLSLQQTRLAGTTTNYNTVHVQCVCVWWGDRRILGFVDSKPGGWKMTKE